jgi:Mrp family chromosome partitioning ATPase
MAAENLPPDPALPATDLPPPATLPVAEAVEPVPSPLDSLRITYSKTRVMSDVIARVRCQPGVVSGDRSEAAETFKMLRQQLRRRMGSDGHRVLGVTSARRCEAKSLTSLNIALSMASDLDAAVMLIDADLSTTGLQRIFELQGVEGLAEYLGESKPIHELLINPGVARFTLLPAGQREPENSAELLATRKAQGLMNEIRQRYTDRLVLVDLPPLLDRADALGFLPHVDTTLLVVDDDLTSQPDLERVAQLLAPYNLIGTVMSRPLPPERAPGPRPRWRRILGL